MKAIRHFVTALAAHLPCRVAAAPYPAFACDCMARSHAAIDEWNDAVRRAAARVGVFFSPTIGTA